VADGLECEYTYDENDGILQISVIPDIESNYYPGLELKLKSVFMQPW